MTFTLTLQCFRDGDLVDVTMLSSGGISLQQRLDVGGLAVFSGLAGVARIILDPSAGRPQRRGVFFGDMSFAELTVVPLPAAGVLLLTELGALRVLRLSRQSLAA